MTLGGSRGFSDIRTQGVQKLTEAANARVPNASPTKVQPPAAPPRATPAVAAKPAAAPGQTKLADAPAAVVTLGRTPPQTPDSYAAVGGKLKVSDAKTATPPRAAPTKPGTVADPVAADEPPPPDEGALVAGNGPVVVDINHSDSANQNKIYWSSDNWATRNYLGVDDHTASVNLGTFAAGTKISFGIDNGNGDFFKTGAATANDDRTQHAHVQASGDSMTIGFEDLRGGGDRDFNDAIISVRGLSRAEAPRAAPPVAAPPVAAPPAPPVAAPAPRAAPSAAPPAAPREAAPPRVTPPVASPPQPEQPRAAPVQGSSDGGKPKPVVDAAPKKPEPKDNRSGLGDGTNPGNGAGRVNSPNQGTNNPNKAPATRDDKLAARGGNAPQPAAKPPVATKAAVPPKVAAVGSVHRS